MTKWRKGDQFTLELEGTVTNVQGEKVEIVDHSGTRYYPRLWFEENATRIYQPFEFGDRVALVVNDTATPADYGRFITYGDTCQTCAVLIDGRKWISTVNPANLRPLLTEE